MRQVYSDPERIAGARLVLEFPEFQEGVHFPFRWCPPGSYEREIPWLGSDGRRGERHSLQGFWMLETPVTQEMWKAVMGESPYIEDGPNYPVVSVSWNECEEFYQKLSLETNRLFILPSDMEWEYACQAGRTGAYNKIATSRRVVRAHEVGQTSPNAWGLYDMEGSLWEWVYTMKIFWTYHRHSKRIAEKKRLIRCGGWCDGVGDSFRIVGDSRVPTYRDNRLGFRIVMRPGRSAFLSQWRRERYGTPPLPVKKQTGVFGLIKKAFGKIWK